jgi:pimeloyl-ACP methyl ester carboxylesterase
MLVDLVQVMAADGMRLHGALETPAASEDAIASPRVDAWICIHGTGSNFYTASTLAGLTPKLLAGGAAVLRGNTRGHDLVSTGPTAHGRGLQGAAFERVDESPLDLAAWFALLRERGYRRVGLLGHSMGAIKAIFTLTRDDPPPVAALVAISPPHLSYSYYGETERADEFLETFNRANDMVSAGRGDELMLIRFPLAYYVSAAGFVDRYGPEEKYNVLRLLDRVGCPTLVTYGSSEMQSEITFRGMSDAVERLGGPSKSLQVAVIAGADHIYSGCHDALAARIIRWLGKLPAG